MVLENGFYNEEIINKKSTRKQREKVPAIKAHFDRYKINIDVSSIGNFDPDDLKYKSGKEMLSLNQLQYYVDSLDEPYHKFVENRALRMYKILRGNRLIKDTILKYDQLIVVDFLTNNHPEENSFFIVNSKQDTVYMKSPEMLKALTKYSDTLQLMIN